ncbi:MAG: hypothetical protein ACFUZC_08165 [Chthoniobacteraceae bacterium]
MSEKETETQEAAGNAAAGVEGHGKIISIDEGRIKEHLSGVVMAAVEDTLNALLDAEAGLPPLQRDTASMQFIKGRGIYKVSVTRSAT